MRPETYNGKNKRTGRLWECRYHSAVIDTDVGSGDGLNESVNQSKPFSRIRAFNPISWVRSQTVPNEPFCSKSGEKPLNIAHFVLIFWRLEAF